MTASITGRKRCTCGKYLTPLANGTMPRHTRLIDPPRLVRPHSEIRQRCEGTGKFPPATVAQGRKQIADRPARVRGGKRSQKRNAAQKARYRRNAAGGYNR